jgi:hypothetical protein
VNSKKDETKSNSRSRNANIQFASASFSFVVMGTLHICDKIFKDHHTPRDRLRENSRQAIIHG